jgi:hypothetical protein
VPKKWLQNGREAEKLLFISGLMVVADFGHLATFEIAKKRQNKRLHSVKADGIKVVAFL